jgi:hypothetical protein
MLLKNRVLRLRVAVGFAPEPRPSGTEILNAETDPQKSAQQLAETVLETLAKRESPRFCALIRRLAGTGRFAKDEWWRQ